MLIKMTKGVHFKETDERRYIYTRPPVVGSTSIMWSEKEMVSFGGFFSYQFHDHYFFNDVWIYNLDSNKWNIVHINRTQALPVKRAFHTMGRVKDGFIIIGGTNKVSPEANGFAGSCQLNDIWYFNMTSKRWTERSTNKGVYFQNYEYDVCKTNINPVFQIGDNIYTTVIMRHIFSGLLIFVIVMALAAAFAYLVLTQ